MAVSFFSSNNSTAAAGIASQSFTDTTTGHRAAVIFAITYANAGASIFTTATIGGVSCPAVTGGEASDAATEPGNVKAYFLDDIPQGAGQAFTVNRTNNAVVSQIVGLMFNAAGATEVYLPGIVLLQGDGAYAEQSVSDGSPGTNSVRVASGYYGGASPAPVGANTTQAVNNDQTAFGSTTGLETTAGQGARLVGFTQATADDRAGVHFAVREVPAAGATSLVVPSRTARNTLLRR